MNCCTLIRVLTAGGALIITLSAREVPAAEKPFPAQQTERFALPSVEEPSGICYHPLRKTLFVVDDGGELCEITTRGDVVQQKSIRSDDFESITVDPSTGLLYIAVEGAESILEVDPDTLKSKREFFLPRTFEGRTVMKQGGQGIEAITFVPDPTHPHGGTFFVANQCLKPAKHPEDISALFEVEVPLKQESVRPEDIKILRCIPLDVIDIAALYYDAHKEILYAVSDETNRLLAFSRTGELHDSWILPGVDQEGFTIDPDGFVYIAQDSGGVLKLKVDGQNRPNN
jgi:uncharacterized protein YjiK